MQADAALRQSLMADAKGSRSYLTEEEGKRSPDSWSLMSITM